MATTNQITLTRENGEVLDLVLDPTFGEIAIGVFESQAQYDAEEMPTHPITLSREETTALLELLRQPAMQATM